MIFGSGLVVRRGAVSDQEVAMAKQAFQTVTGLNLADMLDAEGATPDVLARIKDAIQTAMRSRAR